MKQLLILSAKMLIAANSLFAQVGEEAPQFELTATDGSIHRLSDYRGKVVFLALIGYG